MLASIVMNIGLLSCLKMFLLDLTFGVPFLGGIKYVIAVQQHPTVIAS